MRYPERSVTALRRLARLMALDCVVLRALDGLGGEDVAA